MQSLLYSVKLSEFCISHQNLVIMRLFKSHVKSWWIQIKYKSNHMLSIKSSSSQIKSNHHIGFNHDLNQIEVWVCPLLTLSNENIAFRLQCRSLRWLLYVHANSEAFSTQNFWESSQRTFFRGVIVFLLLILVFVLFIYL